VLPKIGRSYRQAVPVQGVQFLWIGFKWQALCQPWDAAPQRAAFYEAFLALECAANVMLRCIICAVVWNIAADGLLQFAPSIPHELRASLLLRA